MARQVIKKRKKEGHVKGQVTADRTGERNRRARFAKASDGIHDPVAGKRHGFCPNLPNKRPRVMDEVDAD